jgi:dedicator of cytokinesis protein 1
MLYYHEDKPHWYETFKVAIPIEEFKTSHLKFTFKHRSSNEAKDKNEKPFAMSYVSLMQENGTTLKDARHNLVVYKIDYKKFDEKGLDYFKLPSIATDVKDNGSKQQIAGLTMSKDSFVISSNICSTKLTQNGNYISCFCFKTVKVFFTTVKKTSHFCIVIKSQFLIFSCVKNKRFFFTCEKM